MQFDTSIQSARNTVAARTRFVSSQLRERATRDPFWGQLADVFEKAYQNPILTTAEILSDSPVRTYAGTGGWKCYGPPGPLPLTQEYPGLLDPMWIRDACAQYHAYVGIFSDRGGEISDADLAALGLVIEGIVRTSADFLTRKPENITVHAFKRDGSAADEGLDYEPDSLAYLVFLASDYESASGSHRHLDTYFWKAMRATIEVLNKNLTTFAQGVALTKTPYRPSDDQAERLFNIPVNAFCAVAMERLAALAAKYGAGEDIREGAESLGTALRGGVGAKGISEDPSLPLVVIYETDAGSTAQRPIMMDDANVPSLLSLPYLGFCKADDLIYLKTRSFVLSEGNPYYFTGDDGAMHYAGIGSPHTQKYGRLEKPIWPLAITVRGITSRSGAERKEALKMLVSASQVDCSSISYGCDDPDKQSLCEQYPPRGYMHESFEAHDARQYTRGWFAWANALFGEWVDMMVREGTLPS